MFTLLQQRTDLPSFGHRKKAKDSLDLHIKSTDYLEFFQQDVVNTLARIYACKKNKVFLVVIGR